MGSPSEDFDFIVVGGGSAGCVAASALVAEHNARVLLLEAGPNDKSPLIHIPSGFSRLILTGDTRLSRYSSEPQPELGGRKVNILQASVLGGGSSVNAMTYTRGTREDYARWDVAIGESKWGWEYILPHFVRQEANQRLGPPLHGIDGPLKISDAHFPSTDLSRAFLLTLQNLGIPYTPDFNGGDERGASFVQSTTFRGRRWSASKAFLHPLRSNKGLTVRTECSVLNLLLSGDRVEGVRFIDESGGIKKAFAAQEVILTAGAFNTPKLLMLSGIGPADELSRIGITPAVDLPGVGKNLQDHNDISVPVKTVANYGFSGEDKGLRMLKNGLQYLLFGTGPAASTASEVTAFINPSNTALEPNIQLYCVGTMYSENGDTLTTPGVTLMANLVRPKSRGSIRLRSNNPKDPPLIDPKWLSAPGDLEALRAGLQFLRKVASARPLSKLIGAAALGILDGSEPEMDSYIRNHTGTNWHPVGTCRMGSDNDPTAVLDSDLRVRGTRRLRVLDASMMPEIISANTNAAVMAVADRGVHLMMGTRAFD